MSTSKPRGGTSASHARSQKAGQTFEQLLEAHHAVAIERGLLAWWRHVCPAMRTLRIPGQAGRWQVKHIITGEACSDFVAQLHTGRALVVEAKSHAMSGGDFAYAKIKPQQVAQLNACADGGGLALLAIEWRVFS